MIFVHSVTTSLHLVVDNGALRKKIMLLVIRGWLPSLIQSFVLWNILFGNWSQNEGSREVLRNLGKQSSVVLKKTKKHGQDWTALFFSFLLHTSEV